MPTVADVLRQYGPEYIARFGDSMPPEHLKVLNALSACRTGQLGTVHYQCTACDKQHVMGRSCGNRHCPSCQQDKTKAWLQKQSERLLPCPYFLITYTVPQALRDFVRTHQRVAYAAMFEASSAALKTLAADPKFIGTPNPGFFGVLHTWGRDLSYHPHIHYVVPGGGLNQAGDAWLPSRANFYVPVKALSMIYRAKLRDAFERAGLLGHIDPAVWKQDWVVHSQAVGDARASLQYLAPYVFRVAISDRRIRSCDDGQVTFDYRKTGSNRYRRMTLDAMEFLRRFLQHVLPHAFTKVRHYGFLSPNSKQPVEAIQWLVALHYRLSFTLVVSAFSPLSTPPVRCPDCGQPMFLVAFVPPYQDSS
jgi:hypothetical protein